MPFAANGSLLTDRTVSKNLLFFIDNTYILKSTTKRTEKTIFLNHKSF